MSDPRLEPFQLEHLTLRNRIFPSSHELAYAEAGMPYRLYTRRRPGVASP